LCNRGRHIDHPAGRHSIRTNQFPLPPSPYFLQAGCPSCRPTNSIKALKAVFTSRYRKQNKAIAANMVSINQKHHALTHRHTHTHNFMLNASLHLSRSTSICLICYGFCCIACCTINQKKSNKWSLTITARHRHHQTTLSCSRRTARRAASRPWCCKQTWTLSAIN